MSDDFSSAVSSADDGYSDQECADVKRRLKLIKDSREFDESARKQYALDRRRARGDHGDFQINTQLGGSYSDILKSILYARDPDVDARPSDATNPPPMADIVDLVREKLSHDPQVAQMMEEVGKEATLQAEANKRLAMSGASVAVLDPQVREKIAMAAADPNNDPVQMGEHAAQVWLDQTIKAQAKKMLEPYQKRLSEAKMFAKTIEIVVSHLWKEARLKRVMKRVVGSTITVSLGWLKANWQERTGFDPVTARQIADAQAQLDKYRTLQADITKARDPDIDAKKAECEALLQSLQAKDEVLLARGFVADFFNAEDVQVSSAVDCIEDYGDSPWIATRVFKRTEDARVEFPRVADKLERAKVYRQRKPVDRSETRDIGRAANDIQASEADKFTTAEDAGTNNGFQNITDPFVCVWEMQDRIDGTIYTLIEGLDYYARDPFQPQYPTRRFYDLFMLAFIWVDGERHPMSLLERSATLLDEDNRLASGLAEHRKRSIPKTGFDATGLEKTEAERISRAATGEMVPVKPLKPGTPISTMFAPIKYAPIDPALYDDRRTMAKLESIWGIQEALASSVQIAKTATEAEIQQTGTNARSGYKRSVLDDMLDEFALYTTEIAVQALSTEDVQEIAGPWAFWPEGLKVNDMDALVTVQIKGGSSGKPDTSAQQQTWAVIMPLLKGLILEVGQLRQSDPSDIADCMEELADETLSRTGERLDPSRFLPKEPSNTPGAMPSQQGQPQPLPQGGQIKPGPMPANAPPPHDPTQLPVPSHGAMPPGVHQS